MIYLAVLLFFVGKDMWGKHFSRRLEQCKWALGGSRRCLCGSGGPGNSLSIGANGGKTLGMVPLIINPHMDVSKNRGTPKMDGLQWKTLLKMDDLGVPPFKETPIYTFSIPF